MAAQNYTFKPGQGWVQSMDAPMQNSMGGDVANARNFAANAQQQAYGRQDQVRHQSINDQMGAEARQESALQRRTDSANAVTDQRRDAANTRQDTMNANDLARKTTMRDMMIGLYGKYAGDSGTDAESSGGASRVPGPIRAPDTSAASAAAFARAKDQVGQVARGAMTGLRSTMGATGRSQSRPATSVINNGVGQLGEVSREQAIKESDMAQQNELARYSGEVAMRGQDTAARSARLSSRQNQIGALLGALRGLY